MHEKFNSVVTRLNKLFITIVAFLLYESNSAIFEPEYKWIWQCWLFIFIVGLCLVFYDLFFSIKNYIKKNK